jgi:hypothetical protein
MTRVSLPQTNELRNKKGGIIPPFAVSCRRFYTSVAAMITKVTMIATMQIFAANITFS